MSVHCIIYGARSSGDQSIEGGIPYEINETVTGDDSVACTGTVPVGERTIGVKGIGKINLIVKDANNILLKLFPDTVFRVWKISVQ